MLANRSVLTFATNKLIYTEFALNCAQSILLHNDVLVYIVSNLDFEIPSHLKKNVLIIKPKPEHSSLGLGIKIYMDQYLQTENTLFIDADCVCYAGLDPVFEACEDKDVSVVGTIVNAAEWVGEQQANVIEREFNVRQLPRFNAGLLFLKKNTKTAQIFEFARSIIPNYDRFGFQRNNNIINEEGLIAIAMMVHNQTPIADDGRYMTDMFTDSHPSQLNVLTGIRVLRNPPLGKPRHRAWYPAKYSPIVLHFGGSNINSYIYKSQAALLKLYQKHVSENLATLLVNTFIHIPFRSLRWIIGSLRKLKTS